MAQCEEEDLPLSAAEKSDIAQLQAQLHQLWQEERLATEKQLSRNLLATRLWARAEVASHMKGLSEAFEVERERARMAMEAHEQAQTQRTRRACEEACRAYLQAVCPGRRDPDLTE